jgi:hypothetical protein
VRRTAEEPEERGEAFCFEGNFLGDLGLVLASEITNLATCEMTILPFLSVEET